MNDWRATIKQDEPGDNERTSRNPLHRPMTFKSFSRTLLLYPPLDVVRENEERWVQCRTVENIGIQTSCGFYLAKFQFPGYLSASPSVNRPNVA